MFCDLGIDGRPLAIRFRRFRQPPALFQRLPHAEGCVGGRGVEFQRPLECRDGIVETPRVKQRLRQEKPKASIIRTRLRDRLQVRQRFLRAAVMHEQQAEVHLSRDEIRLCLDDLAVSLNRLDVLFETRICVGELEPRFVIVRAFSENFLE